MRFKSFSLNKQRLMFHAPSTDDTTLPGTQIV